MSEEKPLHVRVVEALGWTRAHYPGDHGFGVPGPPCGDILIADMERLRWRGREPGEMLIGADCTLIPRYDTDWSSTGPLIERYGLSVFRQDGIWFAMFDPKGARWCGEGPTPLLAVCNLILAFHAAGKFPESHPQAPEPLKEKS